MSDNSLALMIEKSVAEHSENIAIECGGASLTYAEFRCKAVTAASAILKRINSVRNMPIAVFLPKSAESVVSFAAILYSGNIYAPFNAEMPEGRLKTLLSELDPALLITDEKGREMALSSGFPDEKILMANDMFYADKNRLHSFSAADEKLVIDAYSETIDLDPAYIIFTSGSTGTPKGAAVTHRGVIDYAAWVIETFALDESSRLGLQSGFHFDNSTFDIYGALLSGGTLHIIPDKLFMYPRELPDYLLEKKISCIFWVPTAMIAAANSGALKNLPDLKTIAFAGEVMPTKTLNIWRKHMPNAVFANLYGPTEITVDCTCYIVNRELTDDEPLPIGRARRNMRILLLKDDNTQAASGETGEICVLGGAVALGYWRRSDLTEKVFLQNPLNSSHREILYKTGDLARYDEYGDLIFLGRRDHQIKIGGIRIELGDVEAAARNIDGINNLCTIFDDEKKHIILIIEIDKSHTAEDEKNPSLREINMLLGKTLPRYMLPKKLVIMPELPLTPNKKIDRTLLSAMLKNGEI